MERKIGLITLYKNNYGSILQCYATRKYVEFLGNKCEVLYELRKPEQFIDKVSRIYKIIIQSIKDKEYLINKIEMKKIVKKETAILPEETQIKMDEFISEKLKPVGITIEDLKKNQDSYWGFIAGSDQIWNASKDISDFYFLDFCDNNKKIAFGPSFGITNIPNFNSHIKEKILQFKCLSLREESACKLVEKFYNKEIIRIGDPTLLWEGEDWRSLFRGTVKVLKDKYCLMHFLNEPSEDLVNLVNTYSLNYGFKVVIMGYFYDNMQSINNSIVIYGTPEEYLAYIDSAEVVFTDSFHTSLFSINLETQFYTFERRYIHKYKQSSRIIDMLKRYDLLNHYYEEAPLKLRENLPVSNTCLLHDRLITRAFLEKELESKT